METKYGPIFLVFVVVGAIFILAPRGILGGTALIKFGMEGLLVEQQIAKDRISFQYQYLLNEQAERHKQADHDREMEKLRLQRPATAEEGY